MTARDITAALRGDWHGSYGLCPGPGHSKHDRSLKVTDGQDEDVILHSFSPSYDWREARDWLRQLRLLPERQDNQRNVAPAQHLVNDGVRKAEAAKKIWHETVHAPGTLADSYLQARGITIEIPPAIRFHENLKHGPTGLFFPALVAGLQDAAGRFAAIQRTFLLPDASGKAAVSSPKMGLGPCKGATIRLAVPRGPLWLCEGCEDALSVIQMTGRAAWALPGVTFFESVEIPESVGTIVLAPDNDPAGFQVIDKAAARLKVTGRRVLIARPKSGKDWNDALADYEERAAIAEHDGEQSREEAERIAEIEVFG